MNEQNNNSQPQQANSAPAGSGLDTNVAAALSYLLSWITGVLFFVIEKNNKFVRFHAAQSIVLGITFTVIALLSGVLGTLPVIGFLALLIMPFVQLGGFLLMLYAAWKAYNNIEYEVPYLGKFARRLTEQAN